MNYVATWHPRVNATVHCMQDTVHVEPIVAECMQGSPLTSSHQYISLFYALCILFLLLHRLSVQLPAAASHPAHLQPPWLQPPAPVRCPWPNLSQVHHPVVHTIHFPGDFSSGGGRHSSDRPPLILSWVQRPEHGPRQRRSKRENRLVCLHKEHDN